MADKAIIALTSKNMDCVLLVIIFSNFNRIGVFWHASFAINRGHMLTPKIGKTR
jgi:hypothetical protein